MEELAGKVEYFVDRKHECLLLRTKTPKWCAMVHKDMFKTLGEEGRALKKRRKAK